MNTVDLKRLGKNISLQAPDLGTCLEFVTLWATSSGDSALLARLSAGALGVCIDHTARLPKYKPALHNPKEYGHICLNRLLEYGVTSGTLYEQGARALQFMADKLPTDEGIQQQTDFLAEPAQDAGPDTP
jgi:hypothetical protein